MEKVYDKYVVDNSPLMGEGRVVMAGKDMARGVIGCADCSDEMNESATTEAQEAMMPGYEANEHSKLTY